MGADLKMFLLTADHLVRCHWDGRSRQVEVLDRVLDGEVLREVARDAGDPNRLYAATSTEMHTSEDGGESWKWIPSGGLDYRDIWTMQSHPTRPEEIYVGTLPAAVYASEDGGRSFRELTAFRKLEDYARWTFPPPPHTPHIRCIVLDSRVPDEVVVGVEEGGVVRSRDRGETWEDISGPSSEASYPEYNDPSGRLPYQMGAHEDGRVYRDVHWVRRDPASLDTLYATTGIGTYRTDDGGVSWRKLEYDMGRSYAIPFDIHPTVPERIFLGAAENGPTSWKGYRTVRPGPYNTIRFSRDTSEELGGAKSAILRSDDRGATWRRLEGGLPQGHAHMTSCVAVHPGDPDTVIIGYTDGSVYASHDAGEVWERLGVPESRLYGVRLLSDS